MTVMESLEKLKDPKFILWLSKHATRQDIKDAIEVWCLAKNLHPRSLHDLPTVIEPLWDEYLGYLGEVK